MSSSGGVELPVIREDTEHNLCEDSGVCLVATTEFICNGSPAPTPDHNNEAQGGLSLSPRPVPLTSISTNVNGGIAGTGGSHSPSASPRSRPSREYPPPNSPNMNPNPSPHHLAVLPSCSYGNSSNNVNNSVSSPTALSPTIREQRRASIVELISAGNLGIQVGREREREKGSEIGAPQF